MSISGGAEWFDGKPRVIYFQTQLPVDYIDTTLVQNVWETVVTDLSGGKPARIWFVIIEQTNNAATAESLELEITMINPLTGLPTAYTFAHGAAASGVQHGGYILIDLTAGDFSPSLSTTIRTLGEYASANRALPFISSAVSLIRVRQTSNVDVTSAQIEVNVIWDKLVGV